MSLESVEGRPARTEEVAARPPESEQLPCPRCDSTNTKFCYYNNYNLSQPRHFCKSCRRYWTRGGTLRDIPVGGGSRKASHKRSRTFTATTTPSSSFSTLTYDPIAAIAGIKPEIGEVNLNLNLNGIVCGSFTSLLTTQPVPGFGPFGGFGIGVGSGIRGVGFGLTPWDWPIEEVGGGNVNGGGRGGDSGGGIVPCGGATGCNTWQVGGVDGGFGDGELFGWPELAISTPGKGVN